MECSTFIFIIRAGLMMSVKRKLNVYLCLPSSVQNKYYLLRDLDIADLFVVIVVTLITEQKQTFCKKN